MKSFSSPFDSLPARPEPKRIEHLDQLHARPNMIATLGSSVVDMIPRAERKKYNYLRGASLGAAIFNLLEHDMLNTVSNLDNPAMHFAEGSDAYIYADRVARSVAHGEGFNDTQFPIYMRETLASQLGIAVDQPLPGIIFGLDPRYNDYVLSPSTRGAREGVVWQGAVTLDMIDRHSREALEAILAPLR